MLVTSELSVFSFLTRAMSLLSLTVPRIPSRLHTFRFLLRPLPSHFSTTNKMASAQDPIVKALQQYTTCDVSDALCKLKFRHGGFLSGLTLWSPQRQEGATKIVGPAYTVKYAPLDDPAPKSPTHYIDSIPEGAVVFVSCPPKTPNAVYGGLMSTRAQASKAVGSVIDGRFRDLQEHRELNYPVFARDIGTAPPYELVKVVDTNVPVKLQTDEQDVTINPGDYLIGDLNGVVVLPKELAEKVLPLMAKQADADAKMAVEIRKGMTFTEAGKKFRV